MSVSVWPMPSYVSGLTAAASFLPIIYSNADSTSVTGDVLTVLADEKVIARWGANSWQRAQTS